MQEWGESKEEASRSESLYISYTVSGQLHCSSDCCRDLAAFSNGLTRPIKISQPRRADNLSVYCVSCHKMIMFIPRFDVGEGGGRGVSGHYSTAYGHKPQAAVVW